MSEQCQEPHLGLATTRQLMEELEARLRHDRLPWRAERIRMWLLQLSDKTLDYRTVGS
jgi:hypothetical protein